MDALDFAIFRALSPGGEARFLASRRLIDPRISVREIAEMLKVSETGVRLRLKGMEEAGFLRGSEVYPNPSIFGASIAVAELPVQDTPQAGRVLKELALVEGVTFARDILDEEDRKVAVCYIRDTDAATARRTALLRRLSPTGQLRGPESYFIPPSSMELTPLDWRMLKALRHRPDGALGKIAEDVGVSLKTATRRYKGLLEGRACWWTHSGDSEEMPLALVRVELPNPARRAEIAARLRKELPSWMPVAADGLGLPPERQLSVLAGLVPIETPALLERTVRAVLAVSGAEKARRTFALGSASYPQWFDDRIEARTHRPSGRVENRPPGASRGPLHASK